MMKNETVALLASRNITVEKIAELVYFLQKNYYPDLTISMCEKAVDSVLDKRDVQYAILSGLALDIAAETGNLPHGLLEAVRNDESLYGIDEVLGMAITNIYGTIGVTGFGYLDKLKIGLVGELDGDTSRVNTFADDLVAAIAAAAAAKLAHSAKKEEYCETSSVFRDI